MRKFSMIYNLNVIDTNIMREKLRQIGLRDPENVDDYYLINKHYSRFVKSLKFLASNNFELSTKMMNYLYRADIVIRQEIAKILMPIELSIVSKLQYYLLENNISLASLLDGNIFVIPANLGRYEMIRVASNKTFAMHSTKGVVEKWKHKNVENVIFEMTFGQVASVIKALGGAAFEYILSIDEYDSAWVALDSIINIRNYIAHLGQLFTNKRIRVTTRKTISLGELAASINLIAYGNYNDTLKESINRYQNNVLKKLNQNDGSRREIERLFSIIKNEFFDI